MKKDKPLLIWNGRGHQSDLGERIRWDHLYVCARSRAEASRLMAKALGRPKDTSFLSELKNYYSFGCWGNRMTGITPEVGVWGARDHCDTTKPERII